MNCDDEVIFAAMRSLWARDRERVAPPTELRGSSQFALSYARALWPDRRYDDAPLAPTPLNPDP